MEQKVRSPSLTWLSRGQLVVLEAQCIAVGQGLSGHNDFQSSLLTSSPKEGPPAEEGVRAGRKLRLGGQNAQERQGACPKARHVEKKLEIRKIVREKRGPVERTRRRDNSV